MLLGMCTDGRELSYDASLYEFSLARMPVTLEELHALDRRAQIRWRANELRDWFKRIDADDLRTCHEQAFIERNAITYDKLSAEDRVLADAARDDSVLAGKIVEADPALVHAVVNQLVEEGLIREAAASATEGGAVGPDEFNPLATMELPRGMESLSQLERAKGPNRKMTRSEARLVKKILKNDDRAKEKSERHAAPAPRKEEEEEDASEKT